jgi:hypothetical protein
MSKPTISRVRWMVFALMLSMPVTAEEAKKSPAPIVEMSLGPARIDWHPAVDAQRWVLTVSGPNELFLRREIKRGKAPFLNIADSEGDRLPDGNYAWELKAISKGLAESRRESGSFSIRDGSFVETLQDNGEDASKPPLRGITAKDLIENGNLIVKGNACIGGSCGNSDANVDVLKLKGTHPSVLFDEVGVLSILGGASLDWALLINPDDVDEFSIASNDGSSTLKPFTLAGGAPSNSLYVASNGRVGIGTSSPQAALEVSSGEVRFPHGSPGLGFTHFNNLVDGKNYIRGTTIMADLGGSVGIGTGSPVATLEIAAYGGVEMRMIATTIGTWQIRNDSTGYGIQLLGSGFRAVNVDSSGNMQLHGTLTQGSSRDLKTDFVSLDPRDVLAKVNALPLSTWSYKLDGPAVRHVGPTAEDFYQTFGLGADDKHVAPSDQAGVALVAVQGLTQEIETLRRKNTDLEERIAALEALLSSLKPQE